MSRNRFRIDLDTFRRPIPGQDLLWQLNSMPLAASLSAIALGLVVRAGQLLCVRIGVRQGS